MSLKVAIVGCGKIADGHVEEIGKMPERAAVVAVCDLERLMAEQLAVRYRIAAHYDRFDELLARERPDVVHITTPPQSHLALARQAIDAGCHVYVEKPFAMTAAESRLLVAHAEAARRLVTVGYTYYYDPPAVAMRELVAEGVLGDPVHIDSCYGYNLAGPFGAALLADGGHWVHRLPGKLFQNNIDHLLYKIAELLPDETPAIFATGLRRRADLFGDGRDDMLDELRVLFRGARVTGSGLFSSHARPAGNFVRVYGTRNTIHVDYGMRTVTVEPTPRLPSSLGRLTPAVDLGLSYLREAGRNALRFARSQFQFFAGLRRLLELYYDAIAAGGPPPIAYADILRISAWMDEIFRQVPQGPASPPADRVPQGAAP